MPMPKTRRRNAKPKANNAEALVARLPDDLRSFDAWATTQTGYVRIWPRWKRLRLNPLYRL